MSDICFEICCPFFSFLGLSEHFPYLFVSAQALLAFSFFYLPFPSNTHTSFCIDVELCMYVQPIFRWVKSKRAEYMADTRR